MNKIIEFALSAKFGKDIEPIMEVLQATGNAPVAAEMLLGIYKEPEIFCKNDILSNEKDNKTDIEFITYERFQNDVVFRYHRIIRKEAWFKKGDMPHKDYIASERYWAEDAAKQVGLSIDEFKAIHERIEYSTEIESDYSSGAMSPDKWNEYVGKCKVLFKAEESIDLATLADQQTEAMLSM